MEPVRVRLYGLFPVTKRGYLMQVAAVVLMLGLLVAVRLSLAPDLAELLGKPDLPVQLRVGLALLLNMHWIALGLAVWLGVEAYVVLKAFARKEAEAKGQGRWGSGMK
jgi:hypothetical protein